MKNGFRQVNNRFIKKLKALCSQSKPLQHINTLSFCLFSHHPFYKSFQTLSNYIIFLLNSSLPPHNMPILQCPTIRPTLQQFNDPYNFLHFLDITYKKDYGMVKIVPPEGWRPNSKDMQERLEALEIKNPIEQNVQGTNGYFESKNIVQKKMTFKAYKKYAERASKDIINKSIEEKENLFWKTIMYTSPIYGADLTGTLMDQAAGGWDFNNFDSVLKYAMPQTVKGVTKPYCYIGTWKAFFSWHKEDLDLSAINYIHEGEPKIWYSIAPSQAHFLEDAAKSHYRAQYQQCKQFLRHKTFLINPLTLLKKYPNLKISKAVHYPGEMMLVFGGAYHEGFNCGFNIAEAVNYATVDWFSQLLSTKSCTCSKKTVKAQIESILYNLEQSEMFQQLLQTEEFMELRKYVQDMQSAQLHRQHQVKTNNYEKSRTENAQIYEQSEEPNKSIGIRPPDPPKIKYRCKKIVKTDKTEMRIHFNALEEAKDNPGNKAVSPDNVNIVQLQLTYNVQPQL